MSVIGNKNAQKYSAEDIAILCEDMAELIATPDNGITYITHALTEKKLYSSLLDSWKTIHKNDPTVLESIKRLQCTAKDSLISNALDNNLHATMSMFILKASHGMVEKGVELEINSNKNLVQIEMVEAKK